MKKELMKNKVVITVNFIITVYLLVSCGNSEQNKEIESSKTSDSIHMVLDTNTPIGLKSDLIVNDSLQNEKKKEKEKKIPDSYDNESVYQLRYEYYINKAYDKNTYEINYKPYSYQSKHLDSLIDIYEKKKEKSE